MRSPATSLLLLGVLVASGLIYAATSTPLADIPAHLFFLGLSFLLYFLSYLFGAKSWHLWSGSRVLTLLLLVGAFLRLGAAMAPTSLSDDVYRYAWDGEILARGDNPYRDTPSKLHRAERGVPGLYESLNSEEFHSVYPPLSQCLFALGVKVSRLFSVSSDRALRILFGLFDLTTIWLLFVLAGRLGIGRHRVALYAWNPLVVWELVGGGHTEALLLPFLAATLIAAITAKPIRFGLALGAATLAKLTVLPLAPVLGWYLWRRTSFRTALLATAVCVAVLTIGFAPFWFGGLVGNLGDSFSLYYGHFVFNAPVFDISRWALGYKEGITPNVSSAIMPWFQLGIMASIIAAAAAVGDRTSRLVAGLCVVGIAQVVFTPVFHPWYLVPVILLATASTAWSPLVLSGTVGLSYLAYYPGNDGRVPASVMVVIWAPVVVALGLDGFRSALGPILRRRARRKYACFSEYLRRRDKLLDIGCGEGFVSAEAHAHGHDPMLVDVVDHNATSLPHCIYDGETLPFQDLEFDTGVLGYVLHHCDRPEAVLAEAARVCRQIIVLESVYESAFDRRLLTFLDHLANRFRGIPIAPLQFDTVDGWTEQFSRLGLQVVAKRRLGWFVHKHVLFVLTRS